MRILVTGACGFIGRRMCECLNMQGYEVRRAVRKHDGLPDTVILSDTSNEFEMFSACVGVDCVIHLAGIAYTKSNINREIEQEYIRINVDFPERLANVAYKAGVARFLFASTIKVYGDESTIRPFIETDGFHPRDAYSQSKCMAEERLLKFADRTGFDIVIVRIPIVYGPGVKASFMELLSAVSLGIPLPFMWLKNRRSILYIENLVSALIVCSTHPNAYREIFNIADTESYTLLRLIAEISEEFGRNPRIFPVPEFFLRMVAHALGKGSQFDRVRTGLEISCKKVDTLLGWHPPYGSKIGISATVQWYKSVSRVNV